MPFVEPHSLQWFFIVERADRAFAQTVRAMIASEQSCEICSLCGFPPLGDFHLVEAVTIRREVPSLRLCECCLVERQFAGETLVAVGGARDQGGHPDHRGFLAFWKRITRRLN
ncbi:hypothetical protein [Sphingopyxis fribergensis]